MLDTILLVLVLVLETITQARVVDLLELIVDLVVVEQVMVDLPKMPEVVEEVVPVLSSLHILPK